MYRSFTTRLSCKPEQQKFLVAERTFLKKLLQFLNVKSQCADSARRKKAVPCCVSSCGAVKIDYTGVNKRCFPLLQRFSTFLNSWPLLMNTKIWRRLSNLSSPIILYETSKRNKNRERKQIKAMINQTYVTCLNCYCSTTILNKYVFSNHTPLPPQAPNTAPYKSATHCLGATASVATSARTASTVCVTLCVFMSCHKEVSKKWSRHN